MKKDVSERCLHSCLSCPVRQTTEWSELTKQELELLDRHKIVKTYKAGEHIYHQGDPNIGVHCIHTGLIGLRQHSSDGATVLTNIIRAGSSIGYRSFVRKSEHSVSAVILSNAVVCTLPSQVIRNLFKTNPALCFRFLDHSLRDMEALEERYVQSRSWPSKLRLLHALLMFNEHNGTRDPSGCYTMTLPVSRHELASIVGVPPEVLSRQMHNVQTDGLLTASGRNITIPNIDRIAAMLPISD